MQCKNNNRFLAYLLAVIIGSAILVTMTAAADSTNLDEATIKSYLEKKVVEDPGSCLVENTKLKIIGIADPVPGQQAEAFYEFEYVLRCNRGQKTKSGQGVLKAVHLRDGRWIDRETVGIISK
ncbi:MAG: hypothetical protein PVG51_07135 [Desulfosarcina sp.]|jgi:hypothetical protein